MKIKEVHVKFKLSGEMFAAMLSHGDMDIEVFGEEPRVTHTEQLPPPNVPQITDRGGMRRLILSSMKEPKKMSLNDIRIIVVKAGYSAKSLNGQIHLMQNEKLIKRAGYGVYAITAKGVANVGA